VGHWGKNMIVIACRRILSLVGYFLCSCRPLGPDCFDQLMNPPFLFIVCICALYDGLLFLAMTIWIIAGKKGTILVE
jgi:hypothetical protein